MDQRAKFEQEAKELRESEEVIAQQLERAEKKLKSEQLKNDKYKDVTDGLQALYDRMRVGF